MEEPETNTDALEAAFHAAPPPISHTLACPRCGNFVRELLPELETCVPCATKVLPEGARGELSVSTLLSGTWHLVKKVGVSGALISVAFQLPGSFLFAFVPDLPFQAQMVYGLITLFADILVMSMAYDALLGRNVSISAAFTRATSRYGAVFGARWVSNILTFLALLLFILPGIYIGLGASLATPIALFETAQRGQGAFTASRERTKGHLLPIGVTYGMLIALGIAWIFGMGVVGGILVVIDQQTTGVLNENPPWMPWVTIAGDIGMTLFMLLATFVQTVAYAKTWLTLQAANGLSSPEPVQSAAGKGRDALDAKLDAELAKLD